ncbi:MAG: hypothetical protein M0001_14110 [Treponema sp.]|nr:hypothetical protein [Treponema sp.]
MRRFSFHRRGAVLYCQLFNPELQKYDKGALSGSPATSIAASGRAPVCSFPFETVQNFPAFTFMGGRAPTRRPRSAITVIAPAPRIRQSGGE